MPYHVCGCVGNCCREKEKVRNQVSARAGETKYSFSYLEVIISMWGLASSQKKKKSWFRITSEGTPKVKLNSFLC